MTPHRCAVCGRTLFLMDTERTLGVTYCPDRPCYLYPPLTKSRADDLTLAPYMLGLVESTPTTGHAIKKALGKKGGTVQFTVEQQRKRWSTFY